MKLWEYCNKEGKTEEEGIEMRRLQAVLARADVAAVPAGIRGMSEFFWSLGVGEMKLMGCRVCVA